MLRAECIKAALIAALVAAISVAPLFSYQLGGDTFFHLTMHRLFAAQLAAGDLYPRWLMDANSGLGSPAFVFYFPLGYYAAFPIQFIGQLLGIPDYERYLLCLGLAAWVAVLCCYSWLKDVVSPKNALLAASLYVLLPYRTEALYYRSAYAELWGLALLPLALKYTSQLISGTPRAMEKLALSIALIMTAHISSVAAAALLCGLMVLVLAPHMLSRLAAAGAWGLAVSAWYWLPGAWLHGALLPIPPESMPFSSQPVGADAWEDRARIVLVIIANVLACAALLARIWKYTGRERLMWVWALVLCVLLITPVSQPLYHATGLIDRGIFPWRMQALLCPLAGWLLAVWLERAKKKRTPDTSVADMSLLGVLLLLLAMFQTTDMSAAAEFHANTQRTNYLLSPEYRTRWMDDAHADSAYLLEYLNQPEESRRLTIKEGKGSAHVTRWGLHGIELETAAETPLTLSIGQLYFPLWSASENDTILNLTPEEGTGRILLSLPAGEHKITLNPSMLRSQASLAMISLLLSVMALSAALWRIRHAR